ncbi:MAG: hypothetical protein [Caudoviricetes sp.]|nr:MAG: hypothetical protein [Caudoviricetes sp.]
MLQINIQTKVNSQSIRHETLNGREHIVLPSYTLPANVVMNGGLYPASEIDAHYLKLNGTLAPLGHPMLDGKYISAFDAVAINANHIGAFNQNVKKSGNRVYLEKWVDVAVARQTEGGRELLERVAAIGRGEDVAPIHTSVAVFADQDPAPPGVTEYQWVARIHDVDHDAILLHEAGAATPEQGVGLMVNADQARPAIVANNGVLDGESYEDKRQRLQDAAIAAWVTDPERDYVWIADFTDSQAIVSRNGGNAEVFGYKMEAGRVVFENTGVPVKRKESWVIKANALVRNILGIKAPQINVAKEETEMAFSDEDKALMSQMMANAVADGLKPIQEKVDTLQANQKTISDTFEANALAANKEKRTKVAEKFGEVVANSLQGAALDAVYAQCGEAANLLPNNSGGAQNTGLKADVANLPKE